MELGELPSNTSSFELNKVSFCPQGPFTNCSNAFSCAHQQMVTDVTFSRHHKGTHIAGIKGSILRLYFTYNYSERLQRISGQILGG